MAYRRREQAEKELAAYLPMFKEAVASAHKRFWSRDDIQDLDKGTRSRVIRDYVVSRLRHLLDGKRGVHMDDSNQTTLFCFGQNWAAQIHKFDEAGEVAKNFTQLSMDLRSNTIDQESLPNVPAAATVIFLGYVAAGDLENPDVRLVCPGSGQETWMIDLNDVAAPTVEITPVAPVEEPGTRVVVNPARRHQRQQ